MQWNMADEYGIFGRASPYNLDLGPIADGNADHAVDVADLAILAGDFAKS